MGAIRRKQFEIIRMIAITFLVMDDFSRKQITAELQFHYKTAFKNRLLLRCKWMIGTPNVHIVS